MYDFSTDHRKPEKEADETSFLHSLFQAQEIHVRLDEFWIQP